MVAAYPRRRHATDQQQRGPFQATLSAWRPGAGDWWNHPVDKRFASRGPLTAEYTVIDTPPYEQAVLEHDTGFPFRSGRQLTER